MSTQSPQVSDPAAEYTEYIRNLNKQPLLSTEFFPHNGYASTAVYLQQQQLNEKPALSKATTVKIVPPPAGCCPIASVPTDVLWKIAEYTRYNHYFQGPAYFLEALLPLVGRREKDERRPTGILRLRWHHIFETLLVNPAVFDLKLDDRTGDDEYTKQFQDIRNILVQEASQRGYGFADIRNLYSIEGVHYTADGRVAVVKYTRGTGFLDGRALPQTSRFKLVSEYHRSEIMFPNKSGRCFRNKTPWMLQEYIRPPGTYPTTLARSCCFCGYRTSDVIDEQRIKLFPKNRQSLANAGSSDNNYNYNVIQLSRFLNNYYAHANGVQYAHSKCALNRASRITQEYFPDLPKVIVSHTENLPGALFCFDLDEGPISFIYYHVLERNEKLVVPLYYLFQYVVLATEVLAYKKTCTCHRHPDPNCCVRTRRLLLQHYCHTLRDHLGRAVHEMFSSYGHLIPTLYELATCASDNICDLAVICMHYANVVQDTFRPAGLMCQPHWTGFMTTLQRSVHTYKTWHDDALPFYRLLRMLHQMDYQSRLFQWSPVTATSVLFK